MSQRTVSAIATALTLATLGIAPLSGGAIRLDLTFPPLGWWGCIPSGTEVEINAALHGSGAAAVLCPSAVFTLNNSVMFTAEKQQLYTQGLPTDSTRAMLRVNSSNLTTAINGIGWSGVVVQNLQVDGSRPSLGYVPPPPLDDGDALVKMGGGSYDEASETITKVTGQWVKNVNAFNARGWATIYFYEGGIDKGGNPVCQEAHIIANTVGPAGTSDAIADGISLACGNSHVEGNTVTDATDGAIVIFGAPGSTIHNNTVIAATQELLGGINMVDQLTHGNYVGTQVKGNVIDGRGAFIHVGIAMGQRVWGCPKDEADYPTLYGGLVNDNTLQGKHIGYGYAVNGVKDWTVTGNVDRSRHVGVDGRHVGAFNKNDGGKCPLNGPSPTFPATFPDLPTGFQFDSIGAGVTLQVEFRPARLTSLLRVFEKPILKVATPPSPCSSRHGIPSSNMYANQGLNPDESLASCNRLFRLVLQSSDGNLVLYRDSGNTHTPLWDSNTAGKTSSVAIMQADGNFVIYDSTGEPLWASNTHHAGPFRFVVQDDGNLVIYYMTQDEDPTTHKKNWTDHALWDRYSH